MAAKVRTGAADRLETRAEFGTDIESLSKTCIFEGAHVSCAGRPGVYRCKIPVCRNKKNLPFCSTHLPAGEMGWCKLRDGTMGYAQRVLCSSCRKTIWAMELKAHTTACIPLTKASKVNSRKRGFSATSRTDSVKKAAYVLSNDGAVLKALDAKVSKAIRTLGLSPVSSGEKEGNTRYLAVLDTPDYTFQKLFPDMYTQYITDKKKEKEDQSGSGLQEKEKWKKKKGGRTRHRIQESAIIANIRRSGIFNIPTEILENKNNERITLTLALAELGSGKGDLSHHLHQSLRTVRNPGEGVTVPPVTLHHTLIDRMVFKSLHRKIDHLVKHEGSKFPGSTCCRMTMELRDLDIHKHINGIQKAERCVFFSKHLCGPATDMCLRKISDHSSQDKTKLCVCIATCCHHLLDGENIANLEFFQALGFTRFEIALMAFGTSWASRKINKNPTKPKKLSYKHPPEAESKGHGRGGGRGGYKKDDECPLSQEQRRDFGRRCKLLFDMSRAGHLRDKGGFSRVEVVRYTTLSVDDTLILATK
ncbi:hypothetical protein AAMO2058_000862100 [Amorphochlora amoebiformis]